MHVQYNYVNEKNVNFSLLDFFIHNSPYVHFTKIFFTVCSPFLYFGKAMLNRSVPSCNVACSLSLFSLKCRIAICNLKRMVFFGFALCSIFKCDINSEYFIICNEKILHL